MVNTTNNKLVGKQFADDLAIILHQLEALEPQADHFKKEFLQYLIEMAKLEATRMIVDNQIQVRK